jgi:hypothetical protein
MVISEKINMEPREIYHFSWELMISQSRWNQNIGFLDFVAVSFTLDHLA